ncbi:hypothetical protein D8682_01015 (plasmid) [Buttiauxella sp. 3AFRM03]|uniref:hypothetical protein n=1 Tax=Buttiauxella sp. 3AFRM03 TaxID=2479367 RepID=UPI000EF7C9F0|nr:hypothetical protein [Buttiauxella sp. 3AFRM03]AYN25693.1 hypothetical protein D8682_01015 [Buttiauxella sp. 3AFRM03]
MNAPDQTVTLEDFADLLADEELTPEALEDILAVLAEIKPHATSFQANSPELVQLATLYSHKFQTLTTGRKTFFSSVLSMPIFFMTLPMDEENASKWMKENKS